MFLKNVLDLYLSFLRTKSYLRVGAAILRHLDTNFERTNFPMIQFNI